MAHSECEQVSLREVFFQFLLGQQEERCSCPVRQVLRRYQSASIACSDCALQRTMKSLRGLGQSHTDPNILSSAAEKESALMLEPHL